MLAEYSGKCKPVPAERFFEHLFAADEGWLVTFSGRQVRMDRPEAPANSLADTAQRYFRFPTEVVSATSYLKTQASRGRDAYVSVHLYRERGNRRASNAVPAVRTLWLDEDDGCYPKEGPESTAIVASSAGRRHLYWQLTRPIPIEQAVALNRRLAVWANGDTGKAGAATVLRPPQTRNYKRWPTVDDVTCELTAAAPWEPDLLEESVPLLPETAPAAKAHTPPSSRTGPYKGPELHLAEFFADIQVFYEADDDLGQKFAIRCPWADDHSGGDETGTHCGQRADGGLWFFCHHASCQGRTWVQFRQKTVQRVKKLALINREATR